MVVAEFRQLIRADMARRQLFRDGRVPELLSDPTEVQRLQLAALVALRANDLQEAAKNAAAAEEARPRTAGFHNDTPFDDLRDADDLLAGNFDTSTVGRLRVAAANLKSSSGDPGLDAVLSEIELRVEVELAKAGQF